MSTRYNRCRYSNYQSDDNSENTVDDHVHEFEGSTMFAEECDDKHNHRFAGVTGEAIKYGKSHVHKLSTNTDFVDHHHKICDTTGPARYVGNGKHVHLVKGYTTTVDGHRHEYIFATLIEAPTVDESNSDC